MVVFSFPSCTWEREARFGRSLALQRSNVLQGLADDLVSGFDALGKLEVDSGAIEVLAVVAGLEVHIAGNVIGKEPQAEFKSDQPDRVV